MTAADGVSRHHRHHRLGQAADLHVQVGYMEAPRAGGIRITGVVLGEIARVAAHTLIAARAERELALAAQHDHADLRVLARLLESLRELDDG